MGTIIVVGIAIMGGLILTGILTGKLLKRNRERMERQGYYREYPHR